MPGTVIQKSYVSTVKYDQNGQPKKETYQSQSIKQIDKEGKKIQEKQQAYQNNQGLQKAAHERRLNDKGHKVIKERNRNTGEETEHTIYKGITESKFIFKIDEYDNFNNDYNDYRSKVSFQKNYDYLNKANTRSLPDRRNINQNSNNRQYKALPDNYIPRR
jgi:hypothetical protein